MKRLPALLAATLLTALPLSAQDKPATPAAPEPTTDAALPPLAPSEKDKDRLELMPSKPAQLLPPPIGLPLIPEMPVPADRPRNRTTESPIKKRDSATAAAEDDVKQRIRFREAKTKALRDPAIQAEWDRSTAAKTDYEKREALKSYYKLLSVRMTKIDSSLKTPVEVQLKESLSHLDQDRIIPTQAPSTSGSATPKAIGPRAKR